MSTTELFDHGFPTTWQGLVMDLPPEWEELALTLSPFYVEYLEVE